MKKILKLLAGILLVACAVLLVDYFSGNVHHVNVNNQSLGTVSSLSVDMLEYDKVFKDESLDALVSTYSLPEHHAFSSRVDFLDYIKSLYDEFSCTVEVIHSVDLDELESWVKDFNKTAKKSENAYISKGDTEYEIVKEVLGTEIDYRAVEEQVLDGVRGIDVYEYKVPFSINSEMLLDLKNEANEYVNWYASYSNKTVISNEISNVNIADGVLMVDDSYLEVFGEQLVEGYEEPYNTPMTVYGYDGTKYELPRKTWLSVVDVDSEIDFLKESLGKHESIDERIPLFKTDCSVQPDRFVEVSIGEQHVWVVENGEVVMESDCVTGTRGRHDTPLGVFRISEMINGKYLTGDDYRTWVDRWMRLTNTGIGLHDATWRGRFGGTIYTYDGSHGCINLPRSFAEEIFKYLNIGDCVIIRE